MLQERRETDIYRRGTSRSKGWRGKHTSSSHKPLDANSLMMASIWGALALYLALYDVLGHRDNKREMLLARWSPEMGLELK